MYVYINICFKSIISIISIIVPANT
jgi:hypothetical protein